MNADTSYCSNESFGVGDPDAFAAFLRDELADVNLNYDNVDKPMQNDKETVPFIKITRLDERNEQKYKEVRSNMKTFQVDEIKKKKNSKDTQYSLTEKTPKLNLEATNPPEADSWEIGDEEYFRSLDSKQLEWLKKNCAKTDSMENKTLNCTACYKQIHVKLGHVVRHPLLGVSICKNCKSFYENGIGWEQDEDGSDIYCRWCGHGGEVMVCDNCLKGFCIRCLQRNLGRSKSTTIKYSTQWSCVDCEPEDIYEHKCMYYAVYQYNLMKPKLMDEADGTKTSHTNGKNIAGSMCRRQTFIDQTIGDSLEAIKKYQKQIEEQHTNWLKINETFNSDQATTFIKSLRKLHQGLKRKVKSIDKSVVKSYMAVFPDDANKIFSSKELRYRNQPKQGKERKITKNGSTKQKKTIKVVIKRPINGKLSTINQSKDIQKPGEPNKSKERHSKIARECPKKAKDEKKIWILDQKKKLNQVNKSKVSAGRLFRNSSRKKTSKVQENSGNESEIDIEN